MCMNLSFLVSLSQFYTAQALEGRGPETQGQLCVKAGAQSRRCRLSPRRVWQPSCAETFLWQCWEGKAMEHRPG